jgi:hypothetical protein
MRRQQVGRMGRPGGACAALPLACLLLLASVTCEAVGAATTADIVASLASAWLGRTTSLREHLMHGQTCKPHHVPAAERCDYVKVRRLCLLACCMCAHVAPS